MIYEAVDHHSIQLLAVIPSHSNLLDVLSNHWPLQAAEKHACVLCRDSRAGPRPALSSWQLYMGTILTRPGRPANSSTTLQLQRQGHRTKDDPWPQSGVAEHGTLTRCRVAFGFNSGWLMLASPLGLARPSLEQKTCLVEVTAGTRCCGSFHKGHVHASLIELIMISCRNIYDNGQTVLNLYMYTCASIICNYNRRYRKHLHGHGPITSSPILSTFHPDLSVAFRMLLGRFYPRLIVDTLCPAFSQGLSVF